MSTSLRLGGATALRHFLLVRGLLTAAAALLALRWPDATLAAVAGTAAILFIALGAVSALVAVRLRRRHFLSWLLIGEAASAVAFGALSLLLPTLSLGVAVAVAVAWLVAYGGAVLFAWNALLSGQVMAPALLAWGSANLVLSVLVIYYRWAGVDLLLYAGAAYAAMFSLAEVAAAVWLGHVPPASSSRDGGGAIA